MIVMNTDGDIFDERRKFQRRKSIEQNQENSENIINEGKDIVQEERRSGVDRRIKDINAKPE